MINIFSKQILVDHTRVKLKDMSDSTAGADYINANYIRHLVEYNDISEEVTATINNKLSPETMFQVNNFSKSKINAHITVIYSNQENLIII